MFTVNQDLCYSDLLPQFKLKNLLNGPVTTCKRHFMDKIVEEFQFLLQKENWVELSASSELNTSFNIFMDTFSYYFNTVFPLKVTHVKDSVVNKWITKGIIILRNKLQLLYNIKDP